MISYSIKECKAYIEKLNKEATKVSKLHVNKAKKKITL